MKVKPLTAVDLINAHIPSITDEVEDKLVLLCARMAAETFTPGQEPTIDVGDLAIRRCACGLWIDGFYEYVEHLKEVINTYAEELRAELAAVREART